MKGKKKERGRKVGNPLRQQKKDRGNQWETQQQITNLVGNDAVGHVHYRRSELGPLSGDEVLFEIIALDPGTAEDEVPVKDSIATTLLRRFALPEAPMPEQKVTKESAEHLLRSRMMA